MIRRLVPALLVLLATACGGSDSAGTAPQTTTDETTTSLLIPDVIVASECPIPEEWDMAAPSTVGVCSEGFGSAFGAARVPATPHLMPDFIAGSECLVVWGSTSMSPLCYVAGSERSPVNLMAVSDDANRGYSYGAVLVPEGTNRVVGRTADGIDFVSIPLRRIALLWWPGDVVLGGLAYLYAETPEGTVELDR